MDDIKTGRQFHYLVHDFYLCQASGNLWLLKQTEDGDEPSNPNNETVEFIGDEVGETAVYECFACFAPNELQDVLDELNENHLSEEKPR